MKKRYFIFIICLALIFPISVFANDGKYTILSGTDAISNGDKVDFTISVKNETEATAFEANLKYDTSILEIVSISNEETWKGSNSISNNGNLNIKFTNSGVAGESSVATLKFKVKSSSKTSTTIALEGINITVTNKTDDEGESKEIINTDEVSKNLTIKSDDNTLKNIKINGKAINGFNSKTFDYSVEVDSVDEEIELSATLNDSKKSSFVENFGSRNVKLEYGNNEVLIKTKSESGKIATYKLNIIRKDDREINNDLSSIIINGGTVKINFDKSVLTYNIQTYKLETLDVEATPSDSEAKVEISKPSKIEIGELKVVITVTAVTKDKKEYTLIINNTDIPTDTRLNLLSVKGTSFEFKSDKLDYNIVYNKDYKDGLTIYKTSASDNVEIEVLNNNHLKVGSKVKVVVSALDGSGNTEYTITLIKDNRINFFFLLEVFIGLICIIIIIVKIVKNKKNKKKIEEQEKELEKTKEIKL